MQHDAHLHILLHFMECLGEIHAIDGFIYCVISLRGQYSILYCIVYADENLSNEVYNFRTIGTKPPFYTVYDRQIPLCLSCSNQRSFNQSNCQSV